MHKIKVTFFLLLCIGIGTFIAKEMAAPHSNNIVVLGKTYISEGLIYDSKTGNLFTGILKDTSSFRIFEFAVYHGIKNGFYNYYLPNGQLTLSGQMKNNKNSGEWVYYYPNGQIECRGKFENDLPIDEWVWYYPNGKIKETGWYSEGMKIGNWAYYNPDGFINTRRTFSKNFIISEIKTDNFKSM